MDTADSGAANSVTLVTNQIDKVGGLEHYVNELAARLVPRGFSVTIVAKRTTSGPRLVETRSDGVKLVRTWVPAKSRPWFALAYGVGIPLVTEREIRAAGDAVVHGHFFAPMVVPALERRDYIYTFHGPMHKELLDERDGSYALPGRTQQLAVAMVKAAERRVLTSARIVTVLSEFMAREATEMGARPESLRVLPGGVDMMRFSPGHTTRPPWAEGRFPLLLATRRLATGKGVTELVGAMPKILRSHPRALLVIAGSGSEQSRIERHVEVSGLSDAVRLVGDQRGADLVNWIRSADLCVVPSQREEPFGLATVEALACGTPAVATPGGGSPEILRPLDPRLILPGSTPTDMARGISQLVSDPKLLLQTKARARAHVESRYGWDHVVDSWSELYRQPARGNLQPSPPGVATTV